MVITKEEELYILKMAYVPEHIVSLMTLISKGETFLIDDFLCYAKDNWVIVVGYPLNRAFSTEALTYAAQGAIKRFKPGYVWVIAPEILREPLSLKTRRLNPAAAIEDRQDGGNEAPANGIFSGAIERDDYYKLDLKDFKAKGSLMREVNKALTNLTVEKTQQTTKDHTRLIDEFIKREKPNPMIREFYLSMPGYVPHSKTALLLNARDNKGHLSAFYVVELAAQNFATYVAGCHSKKHYVPHASDVLFYEMITVAKAHGKDFINLGLGVSEGIRRFKVKWGGVPYLHYEYCEYRTGYTKKHPLIALIESKL